MGLRPVHVGHDLDVELRVRVQDQAEVFDRLLGATDVHLGVGAHEVGFRNVGVELDRFRGVGDRVLNALLWRESPCRSGSGRDP